MAVTLAKLKADVKARDMLSSFDLRVAGDNADPPWFDTAPLAPFEIVATKGAGCIYALTGPHEHVLFVTSEGQASLIAASLQECLELVIAHPYWEDALRSSGGDLETLRGLLGEDAGDFEDEILDDNPEIEDYRPLLRKRLGLREPADAAQSLLHAVTTLGAGINLKVRASDGHPCEPLIGVSSGTP
ncbi:MAG: hypothetical protein FJX62_16870 [Alphaproteobacteria bacterium]|nr:hypothetical protein [Alphaproteobacteria bacterium]